MYPVQSHEIRAFREVEALQKARRARLAQEGAAPRRQWLASVRARWAMFGARSGSAQRQVSSAAAPCLQTPC